MYKWSGGTDYRNVCKWCRNCIQMHRGRKKVYKCRVYGITDGPETDWKPEYIACKRFDIQYSGTLRYCSGKKKLRKKRILRRSGKLMESK